SLVLPGEEHIADPALNEGGCRSPSAGIQHRHVSVERAYISSDFFFVAGKLLLRPGPSGEEVPARAARGFRIGRDHLDVVTSQIVPVLDVFGISLSDKEDDRGGIGGAVIG